ncbi:MAG: hypothetical protein ACFFCX_16205 [Candidatus Sifarchaeia archaeon]
MKSIRVLILSSSDSMFFNILRSLDGSQKYDFTFFGHGSENEFIQRFHNINLLKKQNSDLEMSSFLLDVCQKNEIDIILPASFEYVKPLCDNLAQFRAIETEPIIPVTDPSLFEILTHRPNLFEYTKRVLSISTPEYKIIENQDRIADTLYSLGYPQKPILISFSQQSKNNYTRLIDSSKDLRKLFFNEKPDAVYSTLNQFTHDLGNDFPEMTAIEFDCTTEYSIQVLCRKGVSFAILVYISNPLSNKMNTYVVLTKDENYPIIEKIAQSVVEGFGFSYSVSLRLWMDSEGNMKLIDLIPHLRDDFILSLHGGVNLPELMIDMALGTFDYGYKPSIKWGLKMQQVWLELFNYQGAVWKTEL